MPNVRQRLLEVARREKLPERFPDEVMAEVARSVERPGIDDPELVDLEPLPFVTVDGPGTKDLDQALHVAPRKGGFRLRYAIADASYYVRPGTALFAEALARGASFYLPGFNVPMLPRELSEGLVSLGPGVARRALVFDALLDPRGGVESWELVPARVRSRARLTFDEVEQLVRTGGRSPLASEPFAESLRRLDEVGRLRARHEDRQQMVRFRRVEAGPTLDEQGALVIRGEPRNDIELANEQLSILCNALGARYLAQSDPEYVQPVYRVHAPPDPERVASFERLVREVARDRGLPDDPWIYRRAAQAGLAGYLESLPTEGPNGRLARALHRQAMLLNGRSTFSTEATGHFGVGEAVYSRFTAPMREIVGIFCHKEALERRLGRRGRSRAEDEALRAEVIDAANRSKDVQRRLDHEIGVLALEALFADDLARPLAERPLRRGMIMGITSSKLHVLLTHPETDVKVMLRDLGRSLGGAWLDVEADGARLVVRGTQRVVCRLGDEVSLRVLGPDGSALLVTDAEQ